MDESLLQKQLVTLIDDSALTDGSDGLLALIIRIAVDTVRKKRYPFGTDNEDISRYETVILCIALELFGKLGAEGQTKHTEAGVIREWAEESAALKSVIPVVKMI